MPQTTLDYAPATRRGPLSFLRPPPDAPPIEDAQAVERLYPRWQRRILISSIIGYALFYFVRTNLGVAMPALEKQLGISKTDLGLFLTLNGVIYGVSKFINGFLGDRLNARTFMALGLLLCAAANFIFGASNWVLVMGVVWMLNGWFQGMGFPPNARLMTHWFEPRELATKMSIWNISHSIGAAGAAVLCGAVAVISWRLAFFIPAMLATGGVVMLLWALRDRPEVVGLPPVEREEGDLVPIEEETEAEPFRSFVLRQVFSNPYIWLISLANFFVYTVRYGMGNWMTSFLTQTRHMKLVHASWDYAAFEISGLVGMLLSGWATDRFFRGRGARTCLISMTACAVSLWAFWRLAGQSEFMTTLLLCLVGFFIYGPQALVGISVANLATKRAAATAVGLTGIFGYASAVVSGWGLGYVVQHHGWNAAFLMLVGAAVVGMALFLASWMAPRDGYDKVRA
jgi:OPA family glycerol-3-phosphate transporter-like MFS transporter/OPA family sugar phosphate sensor protein UhpC-like MFS transporter